MISIEVTQGEAKVKFQFLEMYFDNAMKFASECIETGENGTQVLISIVKEEE